MAQWTAAQHLSAGASKRGPSTPSSGRPFGKGRSAMTRMRRRSRAGERAIVVMILALACAVTALAAVNDLNEAGRAAYARGDYEAAGRYFRPTLAQAPPGAILRNHPAVPPPRPSPGP